MLEFINEVGEKDMGPFDLRSSETTLEYDANTSHKLAEISPILIWENIGQNCRAKSIYIQQELPSFIATVYFFSNIVRRSIKRSREKSSGCSNLLPMHLPGTSSQYCPGPHCFVIAWVTSNASTPETDKKIRNIKCGKMHEIKGK